MTIEDRLERIERKLDTLLSVKEESIDSLDPDVPAGAITPE